MLADVLKTCRKFFSAKEARELERVKETSRTSINGD
jgi:hypothetical protein